MDIGTDELKSMLIASPVAVGEYVCKEGNKPETSVVLYANGIPVLMLGEDDCESTRAEAELAMSNQSLRRVISRYLSERMEDVRLEIKTVPTEEVLREGSCYPCIVECEVGIYPDEKDWGGRLLWIIPLEVDRRVASDNEEDNRAFAFALSICISKDIYEIIRF